MRIRLALTALVAAVLVSSGIAQHVRVQVGYCTSLKNLRTAKAAGFDYVELSTTGSGPYVWTVLPPFLSSIVYSTGPGVAARSPLKRNVCCVRGAPF